MDTKPKDKKVKEVSIEAFLNTQKLTRAEKLYYTKHYGGGIKTLVDWGKLTKLKTISK